MTLVETIVAFVVAGILITATGALLITGLNLFNDTAARSLDKQIGDTVLSTVREKLIDAESIEEFDVDPISFDGKTSQGAIFTGNDAYSVDAQGFFFLKKVGEDTAYNFSNENFYSGRKVGISYSIDKVETPKAMTVTIKVYKNDDVVYTRSTSFNLMNSGESDKPLAKGEWNEGTPILFTPADL